MSTSPRRKTAHLAVHIDPNESRLIKSILNQKEAIEDNNLDEAIRKVEETEGTPVPSNVRKSLKEMYRRHHRARASAKKTLASNEAKTIEKAIERDRQEYLSAERVRRQRRGIAQPKRTSPTPQMKAWEEAVKRHSRKKSAPTKKGGKRKRKYKRRKRTARK